jgi:hypothetical protein
VAHKDRVAHKVPAAPLALEVQGAQGNDYVRLNIYNKKKDLTDLHILYCIHCKNGFY